MQTVTALAQRQQSESDSKLPHTLLTPARTVECTWCASEYRTQYIPGIGDVGECGCQDWLASTRTARHGH